MSAIKLIFPSVAAANQILQKAVTESSQLYEETTALKSRVATDVQARGQIAEQLRACNQMSEDIFFQTNRLLQVAEYGVSKYKETDVALQRMLQKEL